MRLRPGLRAGAVLLTGASRTTVKALAKKGLLTLEKQEVFRRPELPAAEDAAPVTLNAQQQTAYEGLKALLRAGRRCQRAAVRRNGQRQNAGVYQAHL